jgi:enoyl-CoA hydratase/carnithine racemase
VSEQSLVLVGSLEVRRGRFGRLTLNNPRTLNALNVEMIGIIDAALQDWAGDESVLGVIIDSVTERALCSGGDIRSLYRGVVDEGEAPQEVADQMFSSEYRMDLRLHRYPKPVLCWGQGLVMGGGMGLLQASSHRVITPESRLSMPEIHIGLFTDVGGSWFMNRMPGRSGLFMGLTAAHLDAGDAIFCGLADRVLPSGTKQALLENIQSASWQGTAEDFRLMDRLIRALSTEKLDDLASPVRCQLDLVNRLCDGADVQEVVRNFEQAAGLDEWFSQGRNNLMNGSPITACLVYEQFRKGMKMSLERVFEMEAVMAARCVMQGDFLEGVRALLVDKDKQPHWSYASVADVPQHFVDSFFVPPWGDSPRVCG